MTPILHYLLERWGIHDTGCDEEVPQDQRILIIEGRVTKMAARWELLRQIAGEFTGDKVVGDAEIGFDGFQCNIVVRKPVALIQAAGDDLPIVGEVFRRFGHELGRQTYDLIVEHNKVVYALNDGKPTRTESRLRGPRKEVATRKEVEL